LKQKTTNGKLKNQTKSITTHTCINLFSSPAKMMVSLRRPEVVNFIGAYRQDTLFQKKKTRGVTGITGNDYRIVPSRKDSL
jgi:hypothetical protein